jgi:hypothetical protein
MRLFLLAVALTLALGFSLAAAYYLVGGREALMGTQVLRDSWPAIYALAALFAAIVSAPLHFAVPEVSGRLVAVIIGAWFGEYLVLASGILADELNPANAVFIWIVATGGPIQPVAAFTGALLGGWLIQRAARRA